MEQWLELVKDSVCGLKFKTKLWTERQETTARCRELGEVELASARLQGQRTCPI